VPRENVEMVESLAMFELAAPAIVTQSQIG